MYLKKLFVTILAVVCICTIGAFTITDDDPINKIIAQLTKWTDNNPQEKIYLHTDKPFYAAGDKIWFEAYITIGATHQLSTLSGILNVELTDNRDSVKMAIKVPLDNGVGPGDFTLPNNIAPGLYRLRAYTNYSRNAGDDYVFDKTILIGNAIDPIASNLNNAQPSFANINKTDIQFFPEGGTMVNGLPAKVAYKVVGADGLGMNIKGVIKDDQNNEIATISNSHFGMGVFYFTPLQGKTYKAVVTTETGNESSVNLPVASSAGYAFSINNNSTDKVSVTIAASEALAGQMVNIIAQQNGKVYYAAKTKVDNEGITVSVLKGRFPTGIVQFTLFSSAGEPLNERVIFVQRSDLLKLNIATPEQHYAPRQKVKVDLNVKNAEDKPAVGTFSVAVVDETKVPDDENNEITILTSLLLTSDLKGNVEKPNYYFTNINDQTRTNLDALMLTQGYRRFVWKKILNNNPAQQAFQPERSLSISGYVKTLGGKPISKGKVTIFSTTAGLFTADTVTDVNGRFTFTGMTFTDSIKLMVQAVKSSDNRNVKIELDKLTRPVISGTKTTADMSVLTLYLKNSKDQYDEFLKYGILTKSIMLKEINIGEEKIQEAVKYSDNPNGPGRAIQVIMGEELKQHACARLLECLQALIAGVTLGQDGNFYLNRTAPTGFGSGSLTAVPMLFVIDGVPRSTSISDDNLNANDVVSVEVLKNIAYSAAYGARGGGGVIIITTINNGKIPVGDMRKYNQTTPDVIVYTPKGYYRAREFYAPRYDDPKINAKVADLRSTIFWKPDLITNTDGNASFNFFNADGKGTYKVIIEGIDNEGNLGRQVYHYKVE